MNPDNGDLFLMAGNGADFAYWYRRSLDNWTTTSSGALPGTNHRGGVAYHPNLYGTGDGGLVASTNFSIWGWRKSTDSWAAVGDCRDVRARRVHAPGEEDR